MKAHTPSQICSEGASLRPSGSLSVSQCLCTGLSFKIYSKRKERACHMSSSAPRTTGHSQNTHGRNKLCSWHCTLERQQKLCLGWGGEWQHRDWAYCQLDRWPLSDNCGKRCLEECHNDSTDTISSNRGTTDKNKCLAILGNRLMFWDDSWPMMV